MKKIIRGFKKAWPVIWTILCITLWGSFIYQLLKWGHIKGIRDISILTGIFCVLFFWPCVEMIGLEFDRFMGEPEPKQEAKNEVPA